MLPRKLCRFARGAARNQPVRCIVATKRPDVNLFVRKHEWHPDDAIPLLLEVVRKPRNGSVRPRGALTRREAEVLFWVEKAKSNSQVSDILGIAPATVRKHMERIFAKLGVENRTAAAHTVTSRGAALQLPRGRGPDADEVRAVNGREVRGASQFHSALGSKERLVPIPHA